MSDAEVLIVGAGPAGMHAALHAARAGAAVCLVDAASQLGGQYLRHLPDHFDAIDQAGLHQSWGAAEQTFDAIASQANIETKQGIRVWSADRHGESVRLHTDQGATLTGRTVVLATGSHERALPFPGWELPGVMTVGAAQALVKGQGILPGRRVVVAGSGPLLLPTAEVLARLGTDLRAVVEATGPRDWITHARPLTSLDRLVEGAGYVATLLRHRTPVHTRTVVTAAHGDTQLEAIRTASVDDDWHPEPGTESEFEVDALCISYGFVANLELAEQLGCLLTNDATYDPRVVIDTRQTTSVPGVYAAGEITGVAGARCAAAEGTIAGLAAAADCGSAIEPHREALVSALATRRRERRFGAALQQAFAVGAGWTDWLTDDTIVCRCEETTAGDVRHACRELGANDLRSVKMTCRVGMGRCQGRMCGPGATGIICDEVQRVPADVTRFSRRPVATPIPLGDL